MKEHLALLAFRGAILVLTYAAGWVTAHLVKLFPL